MTLQQIEKGTGSAASGAVKPCEGMKGAWKQIVGQMDAGDGEKQACEPKDAKTAPAYYIEGCFNRSIFMIIHIFDILCINSKSSASITMRAGNVKKYCV